MVVTPFMALCPLTVQQLCETNSPKDVSYVSSLLCCWFAFTLSMGNNAKILLVVIPFMAPYPLAVLHWFESNSPKVSGLLTLYWFICVLRLYWKALSTEKWKVLANSLSFPFKLINSIQFLDWLAMSKVLYDFGPSFQRQKIPRQNRTYEKKQFSSVVFPDVACVENHQKPSPSGLNSSTANRKDLFGDFQG